MGRTETRWLTLGLAAVLTACNPITTTDGGVSEAGIGEMGIGDGGADMDAADIGDGGIAPTIELAAIDPLYVGGYTRVSVTIPPELNVDFDDLTFQVAEGPEGGLISESKDDQFDDAAPHVMLLGGWLPGTYTLEALQAGAVVASASFELTLEWANPTHGPSLWFDGITTPVVPRASSAWGDNNAGVQMFDVDPQKGPRHAILLLINYSDAQFPADQATTDAIKQEWMDHMVDGVNVGGEVRSVAAYYDEVSKGQLTWTAEIHGPITLTKTYAELREGGWGDKLPQRAITQAIAQANVDFSAADSVIFIQPHLVLDPPPACEQTNEGEEICDGLDNDCDGDVDAHDSDVVAPCDMNPTCGDGKVDIDEECDDGNELAHDGCNNSCKALLDYMPWPQAGGRWGPYTLDDNKKRNIAFVSMPWDWPTHDGREIYATLTHEIGHNLGMGDEYTPNVPDRNIAGWDLMHAESQLPHLTLPQRLKMGWIAPEDIFVFNPSMQASQQLELDAIGEVTASPNRYVGLQIRKADGWNYYFEYRLRQPGHIGDHNNGIPQSAPGVLLGTDRVNFPVDQTGLARPPLLKVPVQPNSDGYALSPGETFLESDPPANELRVTLDDADADRALLEIEYGTFKADPAIRPWNPSPWQSPDIKVENPRTLADPDNWANVPMSGEKNTLIATVRNNGNDDAPQVQVDFYVKNYNLGSGDNVPRQYLDSVFVDIPAGGVVDARCEECWPVPNVDSGHYCIEVRMPLYQNPNDLTKVEQTEFNNVAQSNYDRFISDASSPARRQRASAMVTSLYDDPALHMVTATQTQPRYRTYIAHTWVRLQPGERDNVDMMFEYADDVTELFRERNVLPSNFVNITGLVVPPGPQLEENTARVTGGVTAEVAARLSTRIVELHIEDRDGLTALGQVLTLANNVQGSTDDGLVLVKVTYDADPDTAIFVRDVVINGDFNVVLDPAPGQITEITAEYLGTPVFAPSRAAFTP